jgi:hypothetical protein
MTAEHSALIDTWAAWAATARPAGTKWGSMDALDVATEMAMDALDARGVDITYAELQDAINAAR